jgi:hypothetical protein
MHELCAAADAIGEPALQAPSVPYGRVIPVQNESITRRAAAAA